MPFAGDLYAQYYYGRVNTALLLLILRIHTH